jgi:protein-tyrosine phosphatase
MIDIHAHILPGLDDGPTDMEASVGMGRIYASEGVTCVFSTSHSQEVAEEGRARIEEGLGQVRAAWRDAGIQVDLVLGVEVYLRPDTLDDLRDGRLWTLGDSRYVLVEVPYQPWPVYADAALHDLRLAGYVPILAHPERYTVIQERPEKMVELLEQGVLCQVTAGALLLKSGNAVRRTADLLVKHRLAQFIATDAHSPHWRSPEVRDALQAAERLAGAEAVRAMTVDNPLHILAGSPIQPDPDPLPPRKNRFGGLFGRD